jgi:hypothetical protein
MIVSVKRDVEQMTSIEAVLEMHHNRLDDVDSRVKDFKLRSSDLTRRITALEGEFWPIVASKTS